MQESKYCSISDPVSYIMCRTVGIYNIQILYIHTNILNKIGNVCLVDHFSVVTMLIAILYRWKACLFTFTMEQDRVREQDRVSEQS